MSRLDYKEIFAKVAAWQSAWKDAEPVVTGHNFENPAVPGAMKIARDLTPGTHVEIEKPTDINDILSEAAIAIVSPVMLVTDNLGVQATYKTYEGNENAVAARFVIKFF